MEKAQTAPVLKFLFRGSDQLGAVNLLKRVWHKAYLEKLSDSHRQLAKLTRARVSFDSVSAVAAGAWAARLLERLREEPVWQDFTSLTQTLDRARADLREISIPAPIASTTRMEESRWLDCIDAEVFQSSFWDGLQPETRSAPAVAAAHRTLAEFKAKHHLGEPPKYYAVLALDGDEMGKWIAGEKSPKIQDVMAKDAAQYFQVHVKEADVESWLKSPRPVSPSFHLQFSEALANFGLYCARRIVEAHHGQLIYSGGDDVLAMVPAGEAISCAQGLRLAFQGKSKELVVHDNGRYAHLFEADVPEGFIKLKEGDWNRGCRRPAEPPWPLLVLGRKATVSVGLAIGHIKEPLQDMIQEAQAAEKRAKAKPAQKVFDREKNQEIEIVNEGWGRDALAVTLFKRSGETIRWGARFGSPAFELLAFYQLRYRARPENPQWVPPISGKFPYRLAELLERYEPRKELTSDLVQIASREFAHVIKQQAADLPDGEKAGFQTLANNYLKHLLEFKWKDADGLPRHHARPLAEFQHLFTLEAFIARQGE